MCTEGAKHVLLAVTSGYQRSMQAHPLTFFARCASSVPIRPYRAKRPAKSEAVVDLLWPSAFTLLALHNHYNLWFLLCCVFCRVFFVHLLCPFGAKKVVLLLWSTKTKGAKQSTTCASEVPQRVMQLLCPSGASNKVLEVAMVLLCCFLLHLLLCFFFLLALTYGQSKQKKEAQQKVYSHSVHRRCKKQDQRSKGCTKSMDCLHCTYYQRCTKAHIRRLKLFFIDLRYPEVTVQPSLLPL